MKNPNGYGSVYKLPGRRRKPWAVRKTDTWDIGDGKAKQKYIYIGYYASRKEAIEALALYNAGALSISSDITFSEVYERWSDKKFDGISAKNAVGYNSVYKLCAPLYDMRFSDIKLSHMQSVVDASGKNHPTLKKLKSLFSQLFDYGVKNEIIKKDAHIVEYLDIGKGEKSTKHYRFTTSEIDTLWRWAPGNEYVQVILMLIYSGVRPGELFDLDKKNVDLEERSFRITKGKNENASRKVPIHDRTLPFFEYWMHKNDSEKLITQIGGEPIRFASNHSQYTETYWVPILSELGILEYENEAGELMQHTPDDTRHTFTTMWKEAKLDEAMRRKIQGHSGKGIGEIVYTHLEFEKLREELNLL